MNNIAFITDKDKQIGYDELDKFIEFFKNKIMPRSLIFILSKNSLGSLIGYYSFLKNGFVSFMLNENIDNKLLKNLIEIYKPNYLWMPITKITTFYKSKLICTLFDYTLIKINDDQIDIHKDLALLLTTSGSTGSPKAVKISYENLSSNAESISEYLEIDENERPITTLPINYSFGLSVINSHLLKKTTILLTEKTLFDREFWNFLNEYKATSLSGVPYTYEILKKIRFLKMDLPFLKTLTQAGGKLKNELNIEFSKFCLENDKRFFVMYGQTEATARISYLPYQLSLEKIGCIGISIPNGKLSLIDTNDEGIGELVYEGKNVSLGYAECKEDLIKEDENHGILNTGDIAKQDQDGFYYIIGRKKRFIKIFGNRINLDEIEQLLKTITLDCACTGNDSYLYYGIR